MAMLRNMVTSLLQHERITTTVPRAKEARKMAEKVITLGKKGGVHNVRLAQRVVRDRDVLQKVFGELKDRYAKRAGGYTRLMRAGFRRGDAADVAILELVDRPEAAPAEGEKAEK
jgi:large subunit ribosomal protein L17